MNDLRDYQIKVKTFSLILVLVWTLGTPNIGPVLCLMLHFYHYLLGKLRQQVFGQVVYIYSGEKISCSGYFFAAVVSWQSWHKISNVKRHLKLEIGMVLPT